MALGFTFQGDSLSPSSSGPALGGSLGVSIQGITTGGYSSASTPVAGPSNAPAAPAQSETMLLVVVALVAVLAMRK